MILSRPIVQSLSGFLSEKEQAIGKEADKLPKPLPAAQQLALRAIMDRRSQCTRAQDRLRRIPTEPNARHIPELLRRSLDEVQDITPDERTAAIDRLREEFADLQCYVDNHTFRRPEVWFAGEEE